MWIVKEARSYSQCTENTKRRRVGKQREREWAGETETEQTGTHTAAQFDKENSQRALNLLLGVPFHVHFPGFSLMRRWIRTVATFLCWRTLSFYTTYIFHIIMYRLVSDLGGCRSAYIHKYDPFGPVSRLMVANLICFLGNWPIVPPPFLHSPPIPSPDLSDFPTTRATHPATEKPTRPV